MKKYNKDEIEKFLLAIDQNMSTPFELIIIGGTAAALAYHVTSFTKDIDTVNSIKAIEKAYELAKKKTGLNIPMGRVGVEDGPFNYQDRLEEYSISGAKHLKVFVPERHDFVLMKMIRGQQNDIDMVAEMHNVSQLDYEKLIDLIKTEMTSVTGDKNKIKSNLLMMFETIFSDKKLLDAEKHLKNWEKS